MKSSKIKSDTTERSLDKIQDNQNKSNTEALERIRSAVQKSIEKYRMANSSKMEKKFRIVDVKKYFGIVD